MAVMNEVPPIGYTNAVAHKPALLRFGLFACGFAMHKLSSCVIGSCLSASQSNEQYKGS